MAVEADSTTIPVSETSPNDAGLSPCPFCGGADLFDSTGNGGGYFMACGTCGAEGPPGPQEVFMALWNTRAKVAS